MEGNASVGGDKCECVSRPQNIFAAAMPCKIGNLWFANQVEWPKNKKCNQSSVAW